MGGFRGHRIPDYNPFWEEREHQEDRLEYWFWYHLGYDDGYASKVYRYSDEELDKIVRANESLKALVAANIRVNPDFEVH